MNVLSRVLLLFQFFNIEGAGRMKDKSEPGLFSCSLSLVATKGKCYVARAKSVITVWVFVYIDIKLNKKPVPKKGPGYEKH